MSGTEVTLLGGIAGATIFLGLPIGRTRSASVSMRGLLNAMATGVLLFLLFDVLEHAVEPVKTAMAAASDGSGSWVRFAGLCAVAVVGLAIGLVSLVYYDAAAKRRVNTEAGREIRPAGPGAAVANASLARPRFIATPAARLSLLIAMGIGLHNFSEGLAIGQSAAAGDISLATLLIIGFGLHNATEGFGIVGPLAAEGERPTWAFLAVMGTIGGGPTFLGTIVGQSFVNDTIYLSFLALAAGSILYVIVQLLAVARRLGRDDVLAWGLLIGLTAGFATDLIVTAAGV